MSQENNPSEDFIEQSDGGEVEKIIQTTKIPIKSLMILLGVLVSLAVIITLSIRISPDSMLASVVTSGGSGTTRQLAGYCGDGSVQKPNMNGVYEQCDNGVLNTSPGAVDSDSVYGQTVTFCSSDCLGEFTVTGGFCGDGVINGLEVCDGLAGIGSDQVCSYDCKNITNIASQDPQCGEPTETIIKATSGEIPPDQNLIVTCTTKVTNFAKKVGDQCVEFVRTCNEQFQAFYSLEYHVDVGPAGFSVSLKDVCESSLSAVLGAHPAIIAGNFIVKNVHWQGSEECTENPSQ